MFKEMKLYGSSGIIAFIYRNPQDGAEIEFPITFDEPFEAELTFDEIMDSIECEEDAYVANFYACVPSGLLAKMRRGKDIATRPFKNYSFTEKTVELVKPKEES